MIGFLVKDFSNGLNGFCHLIMDLKVSKNVGRFQIHVT